ncbi:hypothetical protein HHX47_DHR4000818 [Lentinula edodes]|nr:hypothetical protein HHX47_DHR4000818 [Lentinula edodes]
MNDRLTSERLVVTGGDYATRCQDFSDVISLYEELQLCSTEASFPQEDIFSFASRTSYFGIISLQNRPTDNNSEWTSISEEVRLDEGAERDLSGSGTTYWNETDVEYETGENTQWGSIIGIMYLVSSQTPPYPPGSMGELSFGIIIASKSRGKGYAKEALGLVLDEAFKSMRCHRIQACLLDTFAKDRAMRLFMGMRFAHEGRRRRVFFSIVEQEWKDVTCLAILDTDWMIRSRYLTEATPTTLWDELLSRHNREREELLRWEEEQSQSWRTGLKRTSSMETIRVTDYSSDTDDTGESAVSDTESSFAEHHRLPNGLKSQSIIKGKGKGKRSMNSANTRSLFNPFVSDTSQSESDEYPPSKNPRLHVSIPKADSAYDGPSFASSSSSPSPPPPIASPSPSFLSVDTAERYSTSFFDWEDRSVGGDELDGYVSSAHSSQWDLLDPPVLVSPTYSFAEIPDSTSESSETN